MAQQQFQYPNCPIALEFEESLRNTAVRYQTDTNFAASRLHGISQQDLLLLFIDARMKGKDK